MYADRRSTGSGIEPRSATIALLVNGAAIAALIFAAPDIITVHRDPPLITTNIPIDPPPEPLPPPKPVARTQPAAHPLVSPSPIVSATPTIDLAPVLLAPLTLPLSSSTGDATGNGAAAATPTPMPPPALIGPAVDPRYAGELQPDYPAEETRAGREGRVVVRVLIGVDGRVKQVERTSATSDAFYRATERQALQHWRFRPATRGGVPEEAWRTMAISFVMRGD